MLGRRFGIALVLGLAVWAGFSDHSLARRRPSSDDPPAPSAPSGSAPAAAPSQSAADKVSQRLAQGMRPYMSGGPENPGWRLAGDVKAVAAADGAVSVAVSDLTYVLSADLSIVLPAVELRISPIKEQTAVAVVLAGEPVLRGPQGVIGALSFARHSIAGEWDSRRDAFAALKLSFAELSLRLSNGTRVSFAELEGKFTTQPASAPERTGHFAGTFAAEGIVAQGGDERWRMTAENGRIEIDLKDMDFAPLLALDYTHALAPGRYNGVVGEIVPLHFAMTAKIRQFPWAPMLREMAPWLAEVAGKAAPDPGLVWGGLWRRLAGVLSTAGSDLAFNRIDARSKGLNAVGKGDLRFLRGQEPKGALNAEVRGINERIANLDRSERKDDPMLYPTLALMTVLGDGRTEGEARVHRFKVEMGAGQIRVNGRDSSGLKPEP